MKSNEQALCHFVSSDLKMSQGLAKKLSNRFRTLASVIQYHNTLLPGSLVAHFCIEQEKCFKLTLVKILFPQQIVSILS